MYGVSARLTRKPGELFTGSGSRSMAPTNASASLQHLRIGGIVADDLDQLHPRDRIEEVQPDQPLRTLQRGAQILQRNARGVGGEDRARLHARLDPGIDLLLQLELFRHRLDDEIGVAHALAVEIGHQAVERVAHVGALADDLAEQSAARLIAPAIGSGFMSGKRHADALMRAPRGDVAAHGAGADDVHAA